MECHGQNCFFILDHFLSFYLHNNTKNHNFDKNEKTTWRYYQFAYVYEKSHDVLFLRYGAELTALGLLLLLYTPNNMKIQNFEKMKKAPGDIIILNMCTINDSHMIYGS